jgi:WD40 repeat protein
VLKGHTDWVNQASYSPDGQFIVTASDDQTARVWQVGWKSLLKTLRERTTACLTKAQRIHYLFEDDPAAQDGYEACERRYGRLK